MATKWPSPRNKSRRTLFLGAQKGQNDQRRAEHQPEPVGPADCFPGDKHCRTAERVHSTAPALRTCCCCLRIEQLVLRVLERCVRAALFTRCSLPLLSLLIHRQFAQSLSTQHCIARPHLYTPCMSKHPHIARMLHVPG